MPLTNAKKQELHRKQRHANGMKEVRHLFVPTKHYEAYKRELKAVISDIKIESCFSCDKDFVLEHYNEREEGYFCDECLNSKETF